MTKEEVVNEGSCFYAKEISNRFNVAEENIKIDCLIKAFGMDAVFYCVFEAVKNHFHNAQKKLDRLLNDSPVDESANIKEKYKRKLALNILQSECEISFSRYMKCKEIIANEQGLSLPIHEESFAKRTEKFIPRF